MPARLLVLVLAFCLWPGASEATAYVAHWAQDGDAIHSDDHRGRPTAPDEDGCPDAGHLCRLTSCSCTGHATAPPARVGALHTAAVTRCDTPAPHAREGLTDPAPEIRPPIA